MTPSRTTPTSPGQPFRAATAGFPIPTRLSTCVLSLAAIGVALATATPAAATAPAPTTGPFAGKTLYVSPWSNAAAQADIWQWSDPVGAGYMEELAAEPHSLWLGDWTSNPRSTVDAAVTAGGSRLRTLVVYNIPHRDCGSFSSGGASNAGSYRWFIDQIAAGLEWRRAIVVLEPDALALDECLTDWERDERHTLLAYAVDKLRNNGASVYIDAGDSAWIGASEMADRLESAGVHRAAGVALNVSHTEWAADEIDYAETLQDILGDHVHYVIDTSRSGRGPTSDHEWCNPRGRGVGPKPQLLDRGGLDAYLWVKAPGGSDGWCNGGPAAGAWWPTYARELVQNAPW